MTSAWTSTHVARIKQQDHSLPLIDDAAMTPILDDLYLWDQWPIAVRGGGILRSGDRTFWMVLSAPRRLAPDDRHLAARVRLLTQSPEGWRDLGHVFPDGHSPGSREWSGSAVFDPDTSRVVIHYTATGVRGEANPTFAQRLFSTDAQLETAPTPSFTDWSEHAESVDQVDPYRSTLDQTTGELGFMRAFRDPMWFADPSDGREYLLFAASLAESDSTYDGCIGAAQRQNGDWTPLPPLLSANGINTETERPHVVWHGGRYYLFFSTQSRTFHPDLTAPTGLYGFVADSMRGPWSPLNESGLVLCNPPESPSQCYSWLVLEDLTVVAFVDHPDGRFVGTLAPEVVIEVSDDQARLTTRDRGFRTSASGGGLDDAVKRP